MTETEGSSVRPSKRRLAQWRNSPWPESAWPLLAAELAEDLMAEATVQKTAEESRQHAYYARMLHDEAGKAFTSAFTDRVYRSRNDDRIVQQVTHLIDQYGVPKFLSGFEKLQMRALQSVGPVLPGTVVPPMLAKIRSDTAAVIIDGDIEHLSRHLDERAAEGVRMNCNRLGEAILGEGEANSRLELYLEDLANPRIDYISVKISSICCQISHLAWHHTLDRLRERLRRLYRAAMANPIRENGEDRSKFVNLDMEEHRDLELTVELFCSVLDEAEFHKLSAGIVLQAYLPDSAPIQRELTQWARQRFESGGAPIRVRIVKGANLAMERIEGALHGWAQTPYQTKAEVDANYKRMVKYGCQPQHARAVHLGIASHNLFDIAYAMLLRTAFGVEEFVGFEMLEGMAEHQRRAVQSFADKMLLYAPLAEADDFRSSITYLSRRLEENTADDNYLRHIFDLQPGSAAWMHQRQLFLDACGASDEVYEGSRRQQDRAAQERTPPEGPRGKFKNADDTDWVRACNRSWVFEHQARVNAQYQGSTAPQIPVCCEGQELREGLEVARGFDPSRPGLVPYTYTLADEATIDRMLACAQRAREGWSRRGLEDRADLLKRVAQLMRRDRGKLIAIMTLDGGKAIWESDAEISEAIDFAEYYSRSLQDFANMDGIELEARGIVLVTPPWNFPFAIPAGGVFAALVAGNSVILKPAPETVLTAYALAQLCWEAGIPHDVLQFVACKDEPVGTKLVKDPRIDTVILTGATSTAKLFQGWRPDLHLLAETGGKNAMIISAVADLDLAIKDIVHSAFGHAGQKCSAASLVVVEKELYDRPEFARRLADAARALPVGSAWDPKSIVTPVISPPSGPLERALSRNDDGETWLLEPEVDPDNPRSWSPGIKLGVRAGSFFQTTECFGPVLGVVRADSIQAAIDLVNSSEYGLTSGFHSLNEDEQVLWAEQIEAGNLYINRATTGAIVQRQPFGGWKASNYGPGAKAGGPNYVLQLCRVRETRGPQVMGQAARERLRKLAELADSLMSGKNAEMFRSAIQDYETQYDTYFAKWHDPSALIGQDNVLRYRPVAILLRCGKGTSLLDAARVVVAAELCGCRLELSVNDDDLARELAEMWPASSRTAAITVETETDCSSRLRDFDRCRALGDLSSAFRVAAIAAGVHIGAQAVLGHGRIELLHYLKEQSMSVDFHRYGNLPPESMWSPQAEETRRKRRN